MLRKSVMRNNFLSLLVEDYEKKHYPVEYPNDPVEAIIFRAEQ